MKERKQQVHRRKAGRREEGSIVRWRERRQVHGERREVKRGGGA